MTDEVAAEGLAPEMETAVPETEPQTEGQEVQAEPGDDAAAETPEQVAAKRRQSFQERIDEKTRLHREAERATQAERERAEQMAQEAAYWRQQAELNGSTADPDQIGRMVEAEVQRREAARQAETVEAEWNKRQADAAAKHDDYFDVVVEGAERGKWVCSETMADAIKTSETGPDVAYHLAKNPAEARRIAALPPIAQVRELGRLEAKLTLTPQATARTATAAPEPTPQVRGVGGKFKVSPDTSDFAAFDKAY